MRPLPTVLPLLAAALFVTGCESTGVKELTRPLTENALTATLLHPARLTSATESSLKHEELLQTYYRDAPAAILELEKRFEAEPSLRRRITLAEMSANTADRLVQSQPNEALAYYLTAAELAYPVATRFGSTVDDEALLTVYNHCCGKVVKTLFDRGYESSETLLVQGPTHRFQLSCYNSGGYGYIDPQLIDELKQADYLQVKGIKTPRVVQRGLGAALVGYRYQSPERQASQPFIAPLGISLPVTATLHFVDGGRRAEIILHDVLVRDTVKIEGKTLPLAADFTAPLALVAAHAPRENLGWKGMVHPDEYLDYMGLYQVEPFRPNQIPVVFVHGLMSSPETWIEALNQLRKDPVLRENYQLLLYMYPTGLPIGYNARNLRERLKDFQQHFDPNRKLSAMRKTVLVGHSMGGILSNTQIRHSGDRIHDFLFTEPLEELDYTDEREKAVSELVYFEANPDVTRAIFVAAPHRGSEWASRGIGKLGSNLIKVPLDLLELEGSPPVDGMTEFGAHFVREKPDSVMSLRPHWPILEEVLKLPAGSHTTYHSVIGNADGKPVEKSSDLVVPYWSAHLEGAASEKIVPASHTTITGNAETIEELRRLLYLHIGKSYTPSPVATPEAAAAPAGATPASKPKLNRAKRRR